MGEVGAVCEQAKDILDMLGGKIIDIANFDVHFGSVNEEGVVVAFGLFEHHDAGGNAGAKKEIGGQLDDAVDVVVVHQVFADFLLRSTAVHDAGEADNGGGAAGGKPAEAVHDESHIGFGFWCQHAGGGEARVVNEQGVAVARPLDGIGRVGDDGFKGLEAFMLGVEERVAQGDIELVVADVVQEHVDTAEVVGGQVDLLPVEALAHVLLAENFGEIQQQRARTAGRVVDFVDFAFSDQGQAGEELGNVLGGEELAAALASAGSVHGHQVFVGIAKSVDVIVFIDAKFHLAHAVHQGDQAFVAFYHGRTELVAVDVHVVEETLEVLFAFRALRGSLDIAENAREGHVEIRVVRGLFANVLKELAGEDKEALGFHQAFAGVFGDLVGEGRVFEVRFAGFALVGVDELREVLGDVAVE